MLSKEEKRTAFIKKARENKVLTDLHLSIFDGFKEDIKNIHSLDFDDDIVESKMFLMMSEYAEEYHKKKLQLVGTPEPLLTDLEVTIKGLEKIHGKVKKVYKPLGSVISLKMEDNASYRVSINRNYGKATLG